MPKKRTGECAYCGILGQLTVDHIPPDCLFDRRPLDIVEVPSCWRCNNDASRDDEYFKTMMVLKDRAGSHPGAAAIRDSVFRGLNHPRKIGFARALVRSIREVPVRTAAGLHAGTATAFDVDLARLDRVVERVTKGLFWRHRGHRLPEDFAVRSYSEEGLREVDSETMDSIRTVVEPVLRQSINSVGDGVLNYWFAFATDEPDASAWVFEFYKDVRFAALTVRGGT